MTRPASFASAVPSRAKNRTMQTGTHTRIRPQKQRPCDVVAAFTVLRDSGREILSGIFRYLRRRHGWNLRMIPSEDELTREAVAAAVADGVAGFIVTVSGTHRDELENDMQLKFQTYTAMSTQLQAARAKVQERTPAFTTLRSAIVPVKPAGPKRMIFVAAMLFLTFMGTAIYILRDIILPKTD